MINDIKLMLLKDKRAELIEEKNYLLSTLEFDCCEDEFLYDSVCDDIECIEEEIKRLYSI